MRNAAFTALLGASALIGVLTAELRSLSADGQPAILAPTPLRIQSHPPPPPSGVQREAMAAILARPLFSPGRRPAALPMASTVPQAALPRLSGTFVHGADRSVIFVPASGSKPVIAHEGAVVGGYIVQAIEAGRVTLAGPDGVHVLRPAFDPQSPAVRPGAVGTPALPPGIASGANLTLGALDGQRR